MSDDTIDNPNDIEAVETRDGSMTLYDRDKQVHYRSIWGARSESRYVFVEGTGLADRGSPWRVLELGFGAAVNFTQTVQACLDHPEPIELEYHSVEYAPVAPELIDFHDGAVGQVARNALAEARRTGEPSLATGFDGRVRLWVHPTQWLDFGRPDLAADAVFYDPFGPRTEPESWTVACFEQARRHMVPSGMLATYSAATRVKRAMFEAGFWVASAPGPGRKREVTFASPDRNTLEQRDNLEILSRQRYLED